jgi:LacI family transcriptional regulator
MLQGRRPPSQAILVAPAKVVVRGSTDLLHVGDEYVAQAVRHIQNHAGRPLRVADLLREVPVSRRLLERRFKQALGRTILDYIQQVRVERCGQLLRETHYSIAEVGRLAGFASTAQMRAVFRSRVKQSPRQYRRHRGLMVE